MTLMGRGDVIRPAQKAWKWLSGSQPHTDKLNVHPHRVHEFLLKTQSPGPVLAFKEKGLQGGRHP